VAGSAKYALGNTIVNDGAVAKVKLVAGGGAATEKAKKRMPVIGADSFSAPRVLSATRKLLAIVGGPAGAVADIATEAVAATPPDVCAGRATIAVVPAPAPVSVGSVTAAAAGTDPVVLTCVNVRPGPPGAVGPTAGELLLLGPHDATTSAKTATARAVKPLRVFTRPSSHSKTRGS
jgi:hypothetical protein